jgi:SAM-dependent MidA family methyltransferase
LKDPGIDGKIILRWILEEWNGEAWTELNLVRIGTGDGLLCIR